MATAKVNAALGRQSGSFTAASASPDASGVFTIGTGKSVTGQLLEFDETQENETEDMSATTSRPQNDVIISTRASVRMRGFLNAGDSVATPTNPVWGLAQSYGYLQVAGTWAGRSFSFIGVVKSYKETISGKGKIEWEIEFGMVDLGSTANPTWS